METLKWRLSKLPTVDELTLLVDKKIITQDEAKKVLFNNETEEERDKKSLESEIKFLREVIEKLSDRSRIVETIKTVEHHYNSQPWYTPYGNWTIYPYGITTYSTTGTTLGGGTITTTGCIDNASISGTAGTNSLYSSDGSFCGYASTNCSAPTPEISFSGIKTF